MQPVAIDGGRKIGPGEPVFVIAEAGVNHNGDLNLARALIDAAADAGADAVKFQTFRAERLVSPGTPKVAYQVEATGDAESQGDMLRALELDAAAHEALIAHCRDRGIRFLSTPFDEESARTLAGLGLPLLKLGSGEVSNARLLQCVAGLGIPLILSTGMSHLNEVEQAVQCYRDAGGQDLVVLHCVSSYPAPCDQVNLRAMATLASALDLPVGYSDHTDGIDVSLAAVALGACVIEKHLTTDRGAPGPDHKASIEPGELADLVRSVRRIESALGSGQKAPADCELSNRELVRRSLAVVRALPAGTELSADALIALRPGNGIPPTREAEVLGRRLKRDVAGGELLAWEDLE